MTRFASAIRRQTSGGLRQAVWSLLLDGRPRAIEEIAAITGGAGASIRPYISALEARGYIKDAADSQPRRRVVLLAQRTGPRAPSWSVTTDQFRDWNRDPAMSARDLKHAVEQSGLSLSGWLSAHGFRPEGATRLRQMMTGQRPVSDEIASAARAT